MKKCINCEEYSKHYKYIWLAIIFELLNSSIVGMNYLEIFYGIKIINSTTQEKFTVHKLIHQIFNYFGTFIISYLILKNQQNKWFIEKTKSKIIEETTSKDSYRFSLIHYKAQRKYEVNTLSFLIIIFSLVILDQAIEKYESILNHLDFWMIELIIISYLNSKLFKIQIYRHHKFVLFFNLFPILFKIITIFLTFKDNNKSESDINNSKYSDENELKIIYVVFWYWVIIGLIIYILLILLRSYSYIKLKWFMDLKYISENKLLMHYGIVGSLFYTIIVTITTFIKCKNDSELGPTDYICNIKKEGNETNETYYESFYIYFTTTSNVIQILIEILNVILEMITFYFYKYYSMMIIKYLTPIHLIFSLPIYYFFYKTILFLYYAFLILFKEKEKLNWDVKHKGVKFFLDISGDIFSIFGFLIYLEVIECSCFGLNINYRKNIIRRGTEESLRILEDLKDSLSESENDEMLSIGTIELI